jgi:hypothetical protein
MVFNHRSQIKIQETINELNLEQILNNTFSSIQIICEKQGTNKESQTVILFFFFLV